MTLLRPFVIVLLAMGIAACGQQAPTASMPTPAPTSTPRPGAFGPTEEAFVHLAIATNDQALKLLDHGATHATDQRLRALAATMSATRRTELAALHDLLTSASVRYQNLHAGHDMPGMPTDQELAALRESPTYDAEFTRLTKAHLAESLTVSRSAAENTTHPATRSLAEIMAEDRAATTDQLAYLLRTQSR